ncbi:hypothetical protein NQ317_009273 [Molorchus minor]|uniref:Lipase domain-containing protein n=1 Tax=Molorchus minor TaxID=1323400 RepID=A0ABQ9K1H7_9CUCU|nr:hypothetical protein NQ317_009273 [Molorchus minor]
MRETVLSKHDINVFVVDWATIALRNYISARYSVVEVGEHIADFIKSLVSTYRLDLSRVYFVGHSLGAHISGNAGAALGGKVGNIVGLDPAGPLFSVDNIDDRLDPTDALFVQAIHTNGGLLGFRQSLGHADYFPNGGSSQPGCILDIAGTCAHARSYIYYAESILSENNFKATLCSSYLLYKLNWCGSNTNPLSQMAGYSIDTRASGDYYLDTNSNPPYAKN